MAVDGLEIGRRQTERLARAEEKDAAAIEREVEEANHLLLRRRLQVNEHIAADDEVDAR